MNLLEVLDHLKIEYVTEGHHHNTKGYVQTDCPFCSPDWKHFRLGINIEKGFTNCWTCGSHGLAQSLSALSGKAYPYVKELTKDLEYDHKILESPLKGRLKLPPGIEGMKKAHRKYLESRNFDPDAIAETWGVKGLGGLSGGYSWRLFIPIIHQGEIVSWTTRAIQDEGKRYRSAEASQEFIPHKSILYGADLAGQVAIVVEGPTDVWRVGPGAVALFGTGYTIAQVRKIANFPLRIICLDSNREAQIQATKLCSLLTPIPGETWNVVLDAKDPGEASEKEIRKLRSFLR